MSSILLLPNLLKPLSQSQQQASQTDEIRKVPGVSDMTTLPAEAQRTRRSPEHDSARRIRWPAATPH
jgi:hypothetical protein